MTTPKGERNYRVGVFRSVEHGRESWSGYTLWLNPAWIGFQGWFEVVADSHRHAVSAAIKMAKAKRAKSAEQP